MKTRPFEPGERPPANPPKLDRSYVNYVRRLVANGRVSERSAIEGIRARAPHLSSKEAKAKLKG